MKSKFIALSLTIAAILTMAACSMNSSDTDGAKIIKKTGVEAAEDTDNKPDKEDNTKGQNSGMEEKGKVLQEDTEEYIKAIIKSRAEEVLTSIKNNDMKELSKAVHPVKGVHFSPYAYVNESTDIVFTADMIRNIGSDTAEYVWGNYDGSGEPIKLTFYDYYKSFIYDKDFINAKVVGYNKILGKGNTLNNIFQVYNSAIIVEYHFPGFDPKYSGIDWESLRLVFEKMNDTWYVVGIIHDQWTV